MIPFWIFLLTGIATGTLTISNLMMAVWGAPTHLVQFISLLGSIALIFSAFVCAFSLRLGRYLSAVSLVAVSTYYFPALSSLLPRQNVLIPYWLYLVIVLLFLASGYSICSFFQRRNKILFPPRASRNGIIIIILFTLTAVGWMTWYVHGMGQKSVKIVKARWETIYPLDHRIHGQFLKFTALDSSGYEVVASDEIYRYLQSTPKQTVDLELTQTFDHGRLRCINLTAIDGQRNNFNLVQGNLQ